MTTKIINNFNSLNSKTFLLLKVRGVIGCVAGAAGSPVLRFLTGTSVGTHTLPIVGTIQVGYLGHGQEPVLEWLHFVEFS
jgi:hypothetical protein